MARSSHEPGAAPVGRLFGIETEYGIWVEGKGAQDLMEESRLLVSAYQGAWAGPWDYRAEDPRRDMRGYRVDHLNYDREDARLDHGSQASHLTGEQQRADRALVNGARLYNDHGHPEYSTAECRTLRDLVAQDRAGEWIVLECARARARETGREVRIYKNNTDFHGMSYGCHEGYLCSRRLPFEDLLYGMLPFLVTRTLYAGAGKTGVETNGPFSRECQFQISQRADFFTEIASVDTLAKRPIFNTRDEAHADSHRYRRVHVISGDANLSEFATALKVGATSAVLAMLDAGWKPLFRLKDPVAAIKVVSRDPSYRWVLELEDGRTMRATDLQRIYLCDAMNLLAGSDPETDWVLREWERLLDDLEADIYRCEDRLDWVAKRHLLETYIEAEGLWWEDEALRSLDLEYHNIDPDQGLYYALQEAGQMERLVTDDEVLSATRRAPAGRAGLRGELVRSWSPSIARISWGRVALKPGASAAAEWVRLPVEDGGEHLLPSLESAKTVEEVIAILSRDATSGEVHAADQG